jgi:hypothetical protein
VYHFTENINWDGFFPFDKKWVEDMHLAALPDASKAVLPVILSFCNENGVSFPSYETIGALAGLTPRTVQEAVKGLRGFPGFEIEKFQTRHGRIANRYHMTKFPPKDETGRSFFFFKSFIEGGNWRMLEKRVSPGLYLVMRHFAYFDAETYLAEDENESMCDWEIPLVYSVRKWDLCEAEISIMAKYAGITRPSVYEGLRDLEERHFIAETDRTDDGARCWRVYVQHQPKFYKRDYLNQVIGDANRKERERIAACKKSSGGPVKNLPKRVKKTAQRKGVPC